MSELPLFVAATKLAVQRGRGLARVRGVPLAGEALGFRNYCAPGFLGHGLRENLMSKEVA